MQILCAVDGSEYAQWGVEALEALAAREPERVTLIHVIDRPAIQAAQGRNQAAAGRIMAVSVKAGQTLLRDAERRAKVALSQAATAPRTTYRTVLAYGPPAATIARHAGRLRADLIMLGSRGLGDIKGFLLGSVSRRVVSLASCPVLVVKQPIVKLTRVALAVDDTKHSRAAAKFLRTQIVPESATVTILSSVESPVTELAARYLSEDQLTALRKPALDRATALVNRLRDDFIKDGYSVVTKVQMDHVIDTIVKHIEAERDELLVIGSRKLTRSERLHLGSVSESLLKYAPCSVLIVRGV